tara:strand:- start:201 stop:488 length:288 start_codon:yes stop_codon:yes gene_type:complete
MNLNVKLFTDGADKNGMLEMYANPLISGYTTNPTLMKVVGVSDYESFAKDILSHIITATNNILKKLPTLGKDLDQFSLETVQMFYDDVSEAGYTL